MSKLPSAEELAFDVIEVIVKPVRHKQLGIVKIIRADRNAVLEAAAEVAEKWAVHGLVIAEEIRALKKDP